MWRNRVDGEMTTTKRRYELKQRAEAMEETRLRITEAAMELHTTVGPARTTTSAIARRAGVQRHTVHRHFPDDEALYAACSAHHAEQHPWPDPEPWRAIADPVDRLERALGALYGWYEETESMFTNILRDRDVVPALRPNLAPVLAFLDDVVEILAAGWAARGGRRRVLREALRHAVAFETWRSLSGVGRAEAPRLMAALVAAAATEPAGRRPGRPAARS
jgi:AcrR family transcriptional regulator